MEDILFVMSWIKDHHVVSLTFGVLSAILWIKSATAKVELGKKIVMVTYEDPELNVISMISSPLRGFNLSTTHLQHCLRLQQRYSRFLVCNADLPPID
ncbi:hypothetical protein [Atlantibacter sp.]|uniref:hypothetical protein n=1 Tax=Atlantibacter sp. TaxID=1903473 RepID=UPI0028AC4F68|nr:hypothetical protein [Atlantibacter sp.]